MPGYPNNGAALGVRGYTKNKGRMESLIFNQSITPHYSLLLNKFFLNQCQGKHGLAGSHPGHK